MQGQHHFCVQITQALHHCNCIAFDHCHALHAMQSLRPINKLHVSKALVKSTMLNHACMAAGTRYLHKDLLLQGTIWNCCWRQLHMHLSKVMKEALQAGIMAGCIQLLLLLTS